MTTVFDRLVSAFVAPADPAARAREPAPATAPPAAPSVAVLAAGDALAAACAVALALALGRGPSTVAMWGTPRGAAVRAPATRGARILASRLAARGHAAVPGGRLVTVAIESPHEALRIAAATIEPCVFVAAAPRDDDVDRVLAAHDRVVVVGEGTLADLAVASAAALGVPTAALGLPESLPARALALAGVAVAGSWRAPIAEALA